MRYRRLALASLAAALAGPAAAERLVNLEVREAPLAEIIGLVVEQAGLDLVATDEVSGRVSLRLRGVGWRSALDVLTRSRGYEWRREGRVVRVARAGTFHREAEAAAERRRVEETLAPLETRLIPVSHARAVDLVPHVQATLGPRGRVTVDERTNTLVVVDVAPDAEADDVESDVESDLDSSDPAP